MKTTINWNIVNTRKRTDKNYPEVGRIIVFKDKTYGIKSGTVKKDGEFLYIDSYLSDKDVYSLIVTIPCLPMIKVPIDDGFCWAYIEDIENAGE